MPRSVRLCAIALALLSSPLPGSGQEPVSFPPEVHAARRDALAERVGGHPVIVPGAHLIRAGGRGRQDPNFWYLTGVESPYAMFAMLPGADGTRREILFLPDSFQFAGAQYSVPDERFRHAAWNRTIRRLAPGPGTEAVTRIGETHPLDSARAVLTRLLAGRDTVFLVMEGGRPYAPPGLGAPRSVRQQLEEGLRTLAPDAAWENATPHVERLRVIKDAHEIERLREAARISAVGMVEAMRAIRPGMNDLELAGVMEAVWKREGAQRASFSPIIASGASAVSLYTLRSERYSTPNRVMRDGELVFIDYGAAEYRMYTSDLCRTFPVNGRFTDEQRRIYQTVLDAQEAALAVIRPGIPMRDVIRAAAAVFQEAGYDAFEDIDAMGAERVWGLMPSPTYWIAMDGQLTDYSGARGTGVRDLGHHVGLEATDSRDYSGTLEPGMVFTVEPKIYVPAMGIAIMIEDMILVTETGYENLSAAAPRTIAEVERVMGAGG